jgi:hypothetical protein
MKRSIGSHADGRTSHVMSKHHDMGKLMSAKANKSAMPANTQQKALKSIKSSKQCGGK